MDISSEYVPYFFLVGLVFIAFFFILSIFGYFFLFLIKNYSRKKENYPTFLILDQLFISFGIGISIYISLSYLLDLFSLFNFFTAYLSFVIFDGVFLIFYIYYYRDDLKYKIKRESLKIHSIKFFSNKDNIFCLGALAITIGIIFITYWIIITESTSLIYTDPFKWYETTFYLLDNGHLNHYYLDYNYPAGHTFFNAGVLLVYPDYLFGYYYFKFAAIYLISLYLIIAITIIRKLFKEKYMIIISLLFILTSRYFLSRTLLYISSSFASVILIISLIIILNKYPDYIMGFFIVGLYFIHNLTAFYFLFVFITFYILRLSFNVKNREIFFKQIGSFVILILISFILLIPYLMSIYFIYGDSIFDFLTHFLERFQKTDYLQISKNPSNLYLELIKLTFPLEYFKPFLDFNLLDLIDDIFRNSIYLFFIFSFIGLFIYLRPSNRHPDKEKLNFFKIFIIIIIVIFFIPYFNPNIEFFLKFRKRILQSFNLPIIIMALYSIEWIVDLAKKLTHFLILKLNFYRKLVNRTKIYSKLLKIESIFIIFLISSLSSSYVIHRYPDYYYYYEDELVEVTLYLRTHAESNSRILREDFDSAVNFRMLYDMKIKKYDVNETSSYEDLVSEVDQKEIDYLIFSKDFFVNDTIDDSLDENSKFKELLENDDYILYRYKT